MKRFSDIWFQGEEAELSNRVKSMTRVTGVRPCSVLSGHRLSPNENANSAIKPLRVRPKGTWFAHSFCDAFAFHIEPSVDGESSGILGSCAKHHFSCQPQFF
jgi:hypothetical protein